jgi:hypothetical protein
MNTVVAINGSPKAKDSASGVLISQIEEILETKITVYQAIKLVQQEGVSAALSDMLKTETLLIVFPLYVDSLPAPVIKLLTMIEQEAVNTNEKLPVVYAVCNCGFYEAEHTQLALNMIENFAIRSGLSWGYGIGIGGGGMILSQSKNMSKGPMVAVSIALQEFGNGIKNGHLKRENVLITPKIPRFLYKLGGNMGWYQMARKYRTWRSLRNKPHRDLF